MRKRCLGALLLSLLLIGGRLLSEEMILSWKGSDKVSRPRLYLTVEDVERIKKTRAAFLKESAAKFNHHVGLEGNGMDRMVVAALFAENPAAQKSLVVETISTLKMAISGIEATLKWGHGPHKAARRFGEAVGLADVALSLKILTPEDRKTILGLIARIGYLTNDPNYWEVGSKKAGYLPNMTSSAYGYRATIAALIPSHPMARKWMDTAMKEIRRELDEWMDSAGGMVECPHYSMVIFDQWLGACLAAHNSGLVEDGFLYDEQLRKAILWFANISTPRDPRNMDFGRLPTFGHTYAHERTCAFGIMAHLWKDKDPKFASQMQWMHLQQGSFMSPGILSYYPALKGYRPYLVDPDLKPKKPEWKSTCYPETGVLLRNTVGDRETSLYMIAGRNHSHYFNDSGSIVIWGKGRELCHDDDYQKRRNKDSRAAHSMIDKPVTYNEERVMALKEFKSTSDFDYTSGVRRGWKRQVGFVKDKDPMAPNYFMVTDTVDKKSAPTIWRLFLLAKEIVSHKAGVTVIGKDDVDMDVFFLRPGKVAPKIKLDKEHISVAIHEAGSLSAILYPRLKTEKPPKVMSIAGGKGAKVVTSAGADYVFLDPEPFSFEQGDVTFEGRAGVVKVRNGKQVKSIPGECEVKPDWPGDRQLRMIRWPGLQYPRFPDYDDLQPNPGNVLVLNQETPAKAGDFKVVPSLEEPMGTTEVTVNWTENALDLNFICEDSGLVTGEKGHDNIKLWRNDCIYIWLEPEHDHGLDGSKKIMIQVAANGFCHDVQQDEKDYDVKAIKIKTTRSKTGWAVQVSLPFKGLGMKTPKPGDVWGINFSRMDQPGKLDMDLMQNSSWVSIGYVGDLFKTGDLWGHLIFADKGATDSVSARKAMDATHRKIIDRYYSKEYLLKAHLE